MNTPIDLDRLAALAAAAMPGPWRYGVDRVWTDAPTHGPGDDVVSTRGNPEAYRNARDGTLEYIAALSPEVVIALLDRLRAAERACVSASNAIVPMYTMPQDSHERAANEMHAALTEWRRVRGEP